MDQPSLFDNAPASKRRCLRFAPSFAGWRRVAREALRAELGPDDIWWQPQDVTNDSRHDKAAADDGSPPLRAPRAFVELAGFATFHRAGDRFALLYEILWRLHHGEPHLLKFAGDPSVVRLDRYAKAVRRDLHKMKAFVRFREVAVPDGPWYVAWFEPEHHIIEPAADFFRRRFTNMRWSILTPDRCAHWEGAGEVAFTAGADRSERPGEDRMEAAWRSYYRSTFNPARIKVAAMQAEMPQKYWRNLPEARDIGVLLAGAPEREREMLEAPPSDGTLHCGPRPSGPAARRR